jgi:hypothetical protein
MAGRTLLRIFFSGTALAFLASCAEYPTAVAPAPTPPPVGYWNGDGVPGSPKIVVSISEQHASFFKGKHLVGESTVSTGKPGFGTPPGQYTVLSKDAAHVSTVFGDYVDDFGNVVKSNIDSRKDPKPPGSHYDGARMPYAMFFRGGYAMHQGYVPPYAASHGCIRVPREMAQTFFDNAPVGTPVIVKEEAVMQSATVPASLTVPPPAPYVVQSTTPVPVRPVRSSVSIPAPTPVLRRTSVPGPTPVALHTPTPAPVYSRTVRTTVAIPASTPVPRRSPAPVVSRPPAPTPLRSPSPAPLQTPSTSAVRSAPAPVVSPTPAPARTRTQKRVHSRHHRHSPTPSPTPAQ